MAGAASDHFEISVITCWPYQRPSRRRLIIVFSLLDELYPAFGPYAVGKGLPPVEL